MIENMFFPIRIFFVMFTIIFLACRSFLFASDSDPFDFSIFVAGDVILTQPWSSIDDLEFIELVKEIKSADVAVANLELVLTNYRGFPTADPGGLWRSARPQIAKELVWAGFDIMGHANNHTFDYGSIGVLETIKSASEAGLAISGSGADLQRARKPVYIKQKGVKIALNSMSSTFMDYGSASKSNTGLHGRPGLNPLKVSVDGKLVRLFNEVQRNILDLLARCGVSMRGIKIRSIRNKDLVENLQMIRQAAACSKYVIVSLHTHAPGLWLEDFAHQAIDEGTDILFTHGTHSIAGIEIYRGKPIFYGLGNFVFQDEQVERLPAEAYERIGLSAESTPGDYIKKVTLNGTKGFNTRKEVWESIAVKVDFRDDRLYQIKIIPLDLGFGKPMPERGLPKIANQTLAQQIIQNLSQWSRRYGTRIDYLRNKNIGVIRYSNNTS